MSSLTLQNEDFHLLVCDTILLINTLNLLCILPAHRSTSDYGSSGRSSRGGRGSSYSVERGGRRGAASR